ncbi:DNA repair protein RadA [Bdellovibrio bacteriovorus]|uniref:DNA repair protein RadA n=1 Tax=Bdellovibrio bacteriovorus TaxID=959 RepID=UPI0021D3E9C7|nr:DNA repair protein RadA [Bdellovibrio bacteriovorus]UXR66173.1 DNA repair protein RadA [Bdellovibrio bacteriovorus]
MAKSKTKTIYTCQNCGAQRPRWEGKCSDCGAWNSYVEELQMPEVKTRGWSTGSPERDVAASKPVTLDQRLEEVKLDRFDTSFEELNRVLGGGLAKGSFVLLGGSPGIGKSTLLLQMAGGLAKNKHKVLYISGEESVSQTGSRAHRLDIRSPLIEIGCESNLQTVMELARFKKPDVLVVDSIQTMFLPDLQAAPGSVSQVRECAGHLMGLAKQEGITVILIGHVTKDGSIAGPKVLEHMVDCVLSFDGDVSYNFRLLRALKNRFGAAHELGVFQMNSRGLEEVSNPSELFLEERGDQLIGSAVFASMEGTRPLLCEVQALTLSSPMAMPRRTALGIDINRLHLLTAVLDRHLDIRLAHSDIFINVVGGLKLVEPASDLAVAAAVLSTEGRRDLDSKTCFFGEIGLTGEVRGVSFVEQRIREADKLGFQHFVIPFSNKRHLEDVKLSKDKKISFVKNVHDLNRIIK